jgi:hypothetical protein
MRGVLASNPARFSAFLRGLGNYRMFGVAFLGRLATGSTRRHRQGAIQGQGSKHEICSSMINSRYIVTLIPLSLFHFHSVTQFPIAKMLPSALAPISPTLLKITKGLSLVRIATGAACFFAPQLTCSLHGYQVPVESALLVRMMGAREAINGGLLFTAEDGEARDTGRR